MRRKGDPAPSPTNIHQRFNWTTVNRFMKILITGSKGQLAEAFNRRFEEQGHDYLGRDLDTLDIGARDAVIREVRAFKPDLIVNCAAYNLVDKAEQDSETAFRANASGPENLALAALETGAFLIHFGSDYIFDGAKAPIPYAESDNPNPLNKYGASKLEGEKLIRASGSRHLILRVSWVFGNGNQNFMAKLLEWAKRPGPVTVAEDEISVPTCAGDIVDEAMAAFKAGLEGTWHLPNTGFCSRYEWAGLIFKTLNIDKQLVPGRMADFNLPARRPGFSVMSNAAISKELGITIPAWQDSVRAFIRRQNA